MTQRTEIERLASMETEMKNVVDKVNTIENSIQNLHGKWDDFTQNIIVHYVARETFEEYKKTVAQKDRNELLQKILLILITTVITGLVTSFLGDIKL